MGLTKNDIRRDKWYMLVRTFPQWSFGLPVSSLGFVYKIHWSDFFLASGKKGKKAEFDYPVLKYTVTTDL